MPIKKVKFFKALGDETRLKIVSMVRSHTVMESEMRAAVFENEP